MFITDARVPHANLVGEPGGGWAVLQLALAHERRLMGDLARTSKSSGDLKPDSNSLIGMARAAGRLSDSHLRQEIAVVEGYAAVNRWNTRRAKNTADRAEAATLVSLGVRKAVGGMFPGWTLIFSPLLDALLWPLATWCLLAPQRRPPDPDKHRPL